MESNEVIIEYSAAKIEESGDGDISDSEVDNTPEVFESTINHDTYHGDVDTV